MNKYFTLTILFIFSFSTLAFANISVYYNGESIEFEKEPVVIAERVYYPMTELVEIFEGTTSWEQSTQTATAVVGEDTVSFTLNSSQYIVNDEPLFMENGVVPVVVDERIYVPIRYLAEGLSFLVGWNYEKQSITVDSLEYYLANPDLADENDKYVLKFYLQYLHTVSELLQFIDDSETLEDKIFYTNTTLNYIENVEMPTISAKIAVYETVILNITDKLITICEEALVTGDFDSIDGIHQEIKDIVHNLNDLEFFN